jgi:hypothetical protein
MRIKKRPMKLVSSTKRPGAGSTASMASDDRKSAVVYKQIRWISSIQMITSPAPQSEVSVAARQTSR